MDEELLRIIDLFDNDEVTTADKIDRPSASSYREEFDDFNKRNPFAEGRLVTQGPNTGKYFFEVGKGDKRRTKYTKTIEEGNEWVKGTRERKGYEKPKGTTIPKSELNKGSQYFYNTDFDNLKTDKTLTKEKKKSKVYSKIRDEFRRTGEYKFKVNTQDKPLTDSQQAKIKKQFPNAKFGPKRKYGFAPTDAEYDRVFSFAKRGYKKAFETGMFKSLPRYAQKELINAFPDVNFKFDRSQRTVGASVPGYSKYGVPITHPRYNSIRTYFDDPKPFRFGFDLRTAGGWTMAQMDRAAMQGNTNYEPILQKPNQPLSRTNKIIGMKDKTGKTVKTYNIKNINKLSNFSEIEKYYDVANLSRTPVSNYENITKLLPKGFDPNKILLNDLLQFISKDKEGINRAKRAIEIHHTRGVKNKATGNFQLLRRDLNKLADTIEQQISKGNLNRAAELDANKIRIETGGQKFGGKKLSAMGDFNQIVAGVEKEMGSFTKTDFNRFKTALQKIGCPGLASGGRANFNTGTACLNKGLNKLKDDPTKLSPGDQQNLRNLTKSAKAVRFLKNFLGPGAVVGELIFEGGVATNKFLGQGMPIKQALGESYINKYILGPKSKIDVAAERKKELLERKMPDGTIRTLQDTPFNIQRGEEFAAAERGRTMEPFMAKSATADAQRLKKREEAMKALESGGAQAYTVERPEFETDKFINEYLKSTGQPPLESGQGTLIRMNLGQQGLYGTQDRFAGGGIAGLSGGINKGPQRTSMNPDSQGLRSLRNRARNL